MVLYNVTVSVEENVENDWLMWMKDTHVPEVMATGYFLRSRIMRLLNERPDATGITYAIQYELENIGQLDIYLAEAAPALQKKHMDLFGEKTMAFRTVLEEV